MPARIRTLTAGDAGLYRELRLRALREHPEAFATSVAEESARSAAEVAERIAPGPEQATLGVFAQDRLVGFATLVRHARAKRRHRAVLAAMYVVPEARARRLGRALLDHALAVARAWGVSEVALGVTVGNEAARQLYASAGFVTYGIEPRSLFVEGHYYDVEWMNLRLPRPPGGDLE